MAEMEMWLTAIGLLVVCVINVILIKSDKLRPKEKMVASILSVSVVASTSAQLYSHYDLEPLHVLSHTLFKIAYLLGMFILVQISVFTRITPLYSAIEIRLFDQLNYLSTKLGLATAKTLYHTIETRLFDQLNYLSTKLGLATAKTLYHTIETRLFDQLNYLVPEATVTVSKLWKTLQSGDLNKNMVLILSFFLVSLLILILRNLEKGVL